MFLVAGLLAVEHMAFLVANLTSTIPYERHLLLLGSACYVTQHMSAPPPHNTAPTDTGLHQHAVTSLGQS